MKLKKEELRRLAEAADQSLWGVCIPDSSLVNPFRAALLIGPRRSDIGRMIAYVAEDAAYIAAARPATVLSLLDENAQLRAENERIRRELAAFRNNTSISGSQIEWIDQILSREGNANS